MLAATALILSISALVLATIALIKQYLSDGDSDNMDYEED